MTPIHIFRHQDCEGPGYLGQFLERQNIPYSIICIDRNAPVPRNIDNVSGLVFMGGPMSVNDPLPWIAEEISLIQQAQQRDIPMLGHCLGGQLIAKALGAQVTKNTVKEIGWFEVITTGTEDSRHWFGDIDQFTAFHWHGETFSIPDGASMLLSSEHCAHQAFSLGNTLALQCHVEVTIEMVAQWTELYAEELAGTTSPAVQTQQRMLSGLSGRIADLQHAADIVYDNWVRRLR